MVRSFCYQYLKHSTYSWTAALAKMSYGLTLFVHSSVQELLLSFFLRFCMKLETHKSKKWRVQFFKKRPNEWREPKSIKRSPKWGFEWFLTNIWSNIVFLLSLNMKTLMVFQVFGSWVIWFLSYRPNTALDQ